MRRRDPLVGRDRELQEIGATISAASEGEGGLLLLAGEAGVGKTTLAGAAVAAAGIEALVGTASQRGSAPYAPITAPPPAVPITAALRAFLRRSPGGLAEMGPLTSQLAVLLPELGPAAEAPDREALFEAIRRAFETLGAAGPTLVLLDDLQWADAATLELLASLAAAAEEWPLLLLGVYRSDEIPRGNPLRRLKADLRRGGRLEELVVEPLDPEATAALAAQVLGAEPGPALRAAVVDRSQGVPFFIEELAAALAAGSLLAPGKRGLELEASASVPVPETIRDVVRMRTDALSADGQSAVQAAAAVGTLCELDLLTALAH